MGAVHQKVARMIRPCRLRTGDTVAVWSPASPPSRSSINSGAALLRQLGLKVVVPETVFSRSGYLAGTDDQRAQGFNELAADARIRAIFCARGGYGSLRLLNLLDFDSLVRNPKILVGFSDATALLAAVGRYCNLTVFHGPMVATLVDQDLDGLQRALMAAVPVKLQTKHVLRAGTAVGPVVGGNLTTFCHLLGTPFEPPLDGAIWFIEEKGEAPYRIDRMLTQMRTAGRLTSLAGIVLGQFTRCGDLQAVHRLVIEACPVIPIVAGLEAGHGSPNLTLPLGLEALLDTGQHLLTYRRSATRK
jgi:muramoyltetrapeptide carboxypeptidase